VKAVDIGTAFEDPLVEAEKVGGREFEEIGVSQQKR
jgi:hypothetical protein